MKKKILLLFTYNVSIKDWDNNGSLEREKKYYNHLSKYFDITFLTFGDKSDLKYQKKFKNIKIKTIFKKRRNFIFNFFSSLFFVIKSKKFFQNYQIIKTNQMWGSWIGVLAKILHKNKLYIRCGYELYKNSILEKNHFLKNYLYFLISFIAYNKSDCIVVTTSKIKKFVITKFKIKKKIHVVPNFIDLKKFKPKKNKKKFRNKILSIGRLEKEKNHRMIINAIANQKISLDIIGKGTLKNELTNLSIQNRVNVKFIDRVDNNKLPEFISKYPIYVQTSNYEGNPKTILEVMAVGVPIIGTNVDGINDLIKSNYNGYLINIGEENKLLKYIYNILKNKKKNNLMMARSILAMNKNDIQKVLKQEIKLIKSL